MRYLGVEVTIPNEATTATLLTQEYGEGFLHSRRKGVQCNVARHCECRSDGNGSFYPDSHNFRYSPKHAKYSDVPD